MNPINEDIKDILVDEDIVFAQNLFLNRMPPAPVDCMCLYNTNSTPPQSTLDGLDTFLYDGVEVEIRCASDLDAHEWSQKIIQKLHLFSNQVVNGTHYLLILLASGPNTIPGGGIDPNTDVTVLTLNFRIQRKQNFDSNEQNNTDVGQTDPIVIDKPKPIL